MQDSPLTPIRKARAKKRGRRPLPAGEARSHTISVRLSTAEHAHLSALAGAGGEKRLGRFLYEQFSNRRPVVIPAVNREAWGRLGKVAGALTTIAKAAAVGDLGAYDRDLIEAVRAELHGVRCALIGVDGNLDVEEDGADE